MPSTQVARPVAVALLITLSLLDFLLLPLGFRSEPYLGVTFVLACGVGLGAAYALVVTDRDGAWWYALAEGLLYMAGCVVTRFTGLPFLDTPLTNDWSHVPALTMLFLGGLLGALSGWVLLARRRVRRRDGPVTSARERAALFPDGFSE